MCVRGREYQDNWCKYAESLEKDSTNVKVREEGMETTRTTRAIASTCMLNR